MQQARVIDINSAISLSAAKIITELKPGMADSIILATARHMDATLWTQDPDFNNMPDVKYIKKQS